MPLLRPTRRAIVSGLVAAPAILSTRLRAELAFADFPFALGIAAGEMTADGFVLWTRLAPRPLEPHGGMPMKPVTVDWEVATDRDLKQVVARGSEVTWPELGHSVHAEVTGLQPATRYFYRFRCAGEKSFTGTVLTTPAAGAAVDRMRFASVGCQHLEDGWYTAYRDVAEQPLDFVFHYGDYIYEEHATRYQNRLHEIAPVVRRYSGRDPYSLDDYRLRYADTKLDPDLQAAHAAHGWYCTYDDHEVQNNWAGTIDQDKDPPAIFVMRRRAALQAWWENMPVRRAMFDEPRGVVDFHRRVDYGRLARIHYPDTRLYRSDQPCDDDFKADCPGRHTQGQDMLDAAQWRWLEEGFRSSTQRWNLLAQQVMVAMPDRRKTTGPGTPIYNMDSWAGYPAAQARLLDLFAGHRGGNIVVLTGDEHRNFANDLVRGDRVVASEFVSTSITSHGYGDGDYPGNVWMTNNPFMKWVNDDRGYVLTEVTPDACVGRYRTVESVLRRDAPVREAAAWAVAAGHPGLVRA